MKPRSCALLEALCRPQRLVPRLGAMLSQEQQMTKLKTTCIFISSRKPLRQASTTYDMKCSPPGEWYPYTQAPQASWSHTRKPLRQVPGAHRCVLPGAPHLDHNRIHTHHTTLPIRVSPHRGCTDRTHIQVPQTAPLLDTMYDLATHRALSANTEKHPLRKLIQQN